ncbi:hypothetical protein FTV88_1419 [Heliorestis convoluta]|uniref:Uncharacterized protein n=1 Tax=Heliorestis convoluta TaxID=356322 RepID=A0A5Q2N1S5_9FIRM|nr:hypothetical protein FTV88_1419 [Heliorestis convoluta]
MQLMLEERDMQEALINAKSIRDFIINLAPRMAQEEQIQ